MKTKSRIKLSELPESLATNQSAFLCCASFENRSLSIPESIKTVGFTKKMIFATEDSNIGILKNASKINHMFENQAEIVRSKSHDPLFTTNVMAKAVRQIVESGITSITIDTTTFTHEMLLILLKLIWNRKENLAQIMCLYTGAQDYSPSEPKERKWLSKGCKEVRSVFGYPGQLVPGRPTCLIVLVGFEHERATRMIIEMDPEYLLLGKGISVTHDSHLAPMEYFHTLVQDMVSSRGTVDEFEFSCRDIEQTTQILNSKIQERSEFNHIIVPLNTKISTVASGMVCLNNPAVQICYAEPETYNFDDYSRPDDMVTIFNIWDKNNH